MVGPNQMNHTRIDLSEEWTRFHTHSWSAEGWVRLEYLAVRRGVRFSQIPK
jgi:hypothetical protein